MVQDWILSLSFVEKKQTIKDPQDSILADKDKFVLIWGISLIDKSIKSNKWMDF